MRSIAPGIPPHIALNRQDAKPLYQQICDGYREAVVERAAVRQGLVLGYGGVTVEAIPRAVEKLREVMEDL